jgi:hypothetical protein
MYVYGSADGLSRGGVLIPGGSWAYAGPGCRHGDRSPDQGLPFDVARHRRDGRSSSRTSRSPAPPTPRGCRPSGSTTTSSSSTRSPSVRRGRRSTSSTGRGSWAGAWATPAASCVYERTTGNVYYDADPRLPGYTGCTGEPAWGVAMSAGGGALRPVGLPWSTSGLTPGLSTTASLAQEPGTDVDRNSANVKAAIALF